MRYAQLGTVLFTQTEASDAEAVPDEDWCVEPHWGLIRAGRLDLELETEPADRRPFTAGEAFYVPGRPAHRFLAPGPFVSAGFAPVRIDQGGDEVAEWAGFEVIEEAPTTEHDLREVTFPSQPTVRSLAEGQIDAESLLMGPWVCSSIRFGRESGYATSWCDLPHWGLVVDGSLAIETELTTELVSRGDVFAVAAGPPGHRLEATDGATIIDYTPVEAISAGGRQAEWRPRLRLVPAETPVA